MFDWLLADDARLWVFLLACVVAVFLVAAAALLELFWEMAISIVVGLVVAAQYGFFIALLAFSGVLVVLYEWGGRKVRVSAKYLPGH